MLTASNLQNDSVIGIDLGGTNIVAGVMDRSARIRHRIHAATPREPEAIVRKVLAVIGQLLDLPDVPAASIKGIGIACPGMIDSTGTVITASNLQWKEVPLRDRVLAIYDKVTVIENDTNAAALAEKLYGAGREATNLVYVSLGTGVGAGIIINDALYRGNGAVGEIGHMRVERNGPICSCGRHGCLEALVGGRAIAQRAESLARRYPDSLLAVVYLETGSVTARDVAQAAPHDAVAADLLSEVAGYVGTAIGNLALVFDPDVIILGGGVAKAGASFLEEVDQEARRIASAMADCRLQLVLSPLGQDSGVIGAASLVAPSMFSNH
jgi:glucokinase